MTRPVLLDLYCGAGGAARGYHDAGFDVIGVDINPQPNFPYRFVQGDALDVLAGADLLPPFAAVHASPPCQDWSALHRNYGAPTHGTGHLLHATLRALARQEPPCLHPFHRRAVDLPPVRSPDPQPLEGAPMTDEELAELALGMVIDDINGTIHDEVFLSEQLEDQFDALDEGEAQELIDRLAAALRAIRNGLAAAPAGGAQ